MFATDLKKCSFGKFICIYSLLKEFSQENVDEIIEDAERKAVLYATNRIS